MEAPRGAADAAVLVEAAVRAAVQGRAPRRTVAAVARSALSAALFALREAPPAAAPPPAAAAAAPATEGAAAPKARSAAWVERRRRRRQRLAARRRDGAGAEAAPAGESAALAALPPQAEADADGDDAIDDDRWADGLVRGGAAAAAAAAPPAAGSDAEQRDLVARFCAVKMAGLDPAAEVVAALMSVGADELRRQIAAASSSLGSSPAGRGPPGAPQPGEHSRFFSSSMAPQQQRNGYFKCYSCSYAWNWKSKQACHWCGKALAPWTDVPPPVQGAWAARVSAAVQAEAKNTQPTNAEGGWEPWSSWPKSRRRRGKGNGKDQDEDWWASKNDTPKARSAEDILAELQAVAPHIDKAAIDGIKSQIPPPQPQKPADLNEIYSRAQATERRCKNNLERLLESEQKALNWYTERKQANPQRQRQLTLKARRPHPIINTMDAVLDPFDELAELDAHFDYAESGQYATAPPETLSSVGGDETAQTVDHPVVEPAALDPISYAIPLDLWQKQWQEALPTPCKQPHAHFAYRHWEHDADPLNLKYAKWVSALENTMISHHQIDPKEAAAYTGRAQGYQLSWKKTAAAPGRVHAHDPHAEWWAITLTLIMRYAALFDKPKHTALMEQQAIIIQQCADHFNSHMHDLQFEKDEDTIFRWFALVWAPHLDKDDTDDLVTITATWASRALSAALAKSKRAYGAWLAQQWKHRPGVLHAHVKPAPVRHTEAYTSNLTIADPTVIIDNKKQQWQQVWHATETSDDILQALTKFAACGEVLWSRGPRVISGKAIHPSHVLAAIPKWQMFFCVKCGHTATHQEALSGLEAWSAWAKRGGSRGWRALRAGAARARPVGRGPTAAAASRERAGPRAGRGRQMAAPSAARLRAALAAKGALGFGAAAAASLYYTDEGFRRAVQFNHDVLPIALRYKAAQLYGEYRSPEASAEMFAGLHRQYAPRTLDIILQQKGFYVKVAQFLSQYPDVLPPQYIEAYEVLRDSAPSLPFEAVRDIVESELGAGLEHFFLHFDREPLGAASIGQAHGARLRDGTDVVVKVQFPEAEQQFHIDVELAIRMCRALGPQYVDILRQLQKNFAYEFDYRREARLQRQAHANLRSSEGVVVPLPFDDEHGLCARLFGRGLVTKRVFVMERLRGRPVDKWAAQQVAEMAAREGVEPQEVWRRLQSMTAEQAQRLVPSEASLRAYRALLAVRDAVRNGCAACYNWTVGWLGAPIAYRWSSRPVNVYQVVDWLFAVQSKCIFEDGFVNSDPHAGNVLLLDDGRLGLIDWGQVCQLTPQQRVTLAKALLAVADRDEPLIARMAWSMGVQTKNASDWVVMKLGIFWLGSFGDDVVGELGGATCFEENLTKIDRIVKAGDAYFGAVRCIRGLPGVGPCSRASSPAFRAILEHTSAVPPGPRGTCYGYQPGTSPYP
ncbi:unnamed protein product, partial [Prorocentrum cordatum]